MISPGKGFIHIASLLGHENGGIGDDDILTNAVMTNLHALLKPCPSKS